jgi:hypothetical protein
MSRERTNPAPPTNAVLDHLKYSKLTLQMKVHPDYARGNRRKNLPTTTVKLDKQYAKAFERVVHELRSYLTQVQVHSMASNRHVICNVFANGFGRIGTVELTSDANATLRCCEGHLVCDTGTLMAEAKARADHDAAINMARAEIANASMVLFEQFASTVKFSFENTLINTMSNVEVEFAATRCDDIIKAARANQHQDGTAPLTVAWSQAIPRLIAHIKAIGLRGTRYDSTAFEITPHLDGTDPYMVKMDMSINQSIRCDRPEFFNEFMVLIATARDMVNSIFESHPNINEDMMALRRKWDAVAIPFSNQ